jgi:hypothetical protein
MIVGDGIADIQLKYRPSVRMQHAHAVVEFGRGGA